MAQRRRYRRYITSSKYRKTGDIGFGVALLVVIGGYLIVEYFEYVVALVVFGLLSWSTYRNVQRRNLISSGIEDIDNMHWREFEKYLGTLFTAHGYSATVTQGSGDYGADVVFMKMGHRIVVQAKHYSRNVGIKAVQEVNAAKAYYRASEAWVVTNKDFTPQAYKLASATHVRMINRQELIKLIVAVQGKKNRKAI